MTTTLRSTTVAGVTAKGAPLTYAELDNNFLFTQSGTGASTETVQTALRRIVFAESFGATGNGTTDDTAAIQAALDAVKTAGGGVVRLLDGTFIVTQIKLRDGVELWGSGRGATTIKLKASSNTDIFIKHASDTGLQTGFRHLTVNGNDANNTTGGVFFDGPEATHGPSLVIEDVLITACRPCTGGSSSAAVLLEGSAWGVLRDVDIYNNLHAVGLHHKGSDWLFDGLYCSTNGNTSGNQSCIIQAGAGNRFVGCYWGGNGGLEQVLLWGAQRNDFIGCYNDNAWQHAWRLIAFSATESTDNRWVGGTTSSPGQSTTNTYSAFQFEDGSARNVIVGQSIRNLTATVGKYAISEEDTAGSNRFSGCILGTDFGTATLNLRSGGATIVDRGDGSAADPTYGFAAEAGVGLWRRASNVLSVALSGANYAQFSTGSFTLQSAISFASGDVANVAPDVSISRGAADVLELATGDSLRPADAAGQKLGDASHTWRVYHDVVATASLPAAGATMNGVVLIEDAGAGDRNLIVYAGGERFRIDGGATF